MIHSLFPPDWMILASIEGREAGGHLVLIETDLLLSKVQVRQIQLHPY
jgi:hypothetical protein